MRNYSILLLLLLLLLPLLPFSITGKLLCLRCRRYCNWRQAEWHSRIFIACTDQLWAPLPRE